MSDWQQVALGEICNIEIGGTPSRSEARYWWKTDNDGARLPWVSISDMKGKVITDTKESITEIGALQSNCKHVQKGTLLMSFKLTIGRLAFAGRDLYTNEAISAITPFKDVCPEFLYYGLQYWNLTGDSDQAVKGVTLNKQKLQEISCLLPPLPEQKKIAEILSGVDKRIMLGKLDCEKHDLLASATIKSAIDRLDASSSTCRHLGAAAICEKIFVGIASSTTHAYTDKKGIPMLRNQNIKSGAIDDADLVFINRDFANEQKSRRLLHGDVITARTGYPGTSAVVSKKFENCHSFTTLISRVDKRIAFPEYYSLYLNSPQGKAQVAQLQAGGAQENLNAGALEKMIIPIPDLDVQESIIRVSQELQRTHRAKILIVEKYERLKDALSADLLSGRKRVTL